MDYVDSLELFGAPAKEIPNIKGSGAPTKTTEGAVGCLYMNTDNGDMYKCTAVADGVYTWVEVASGKGNNAPPIVNTVSGEVVSITDSTDLPLQGLTVFGKTTQFTTTGKNLIPSPFMGQETYTASGITITNNEDGSITLSGTATETLVAEQLFDSLLAAGTYTLSFNNPTANGSVYMLVRNENNQHGDALLYASSVNAKLTYTASDARKSIVLLILSGTTLSGFTIKPQLEIGSTATAYEPYTGGFASPNPAYPQDIVSVGDSGSHTVTVIGKNLIPFPYYQMGRTTNGLTFTVNDDGSITVTGTATGNAYLVLAAGIDFGETNMDARVGVAKPTNGIYTASKRLYYNAVGKMLSLEFDPDDGFSGNETFYPQVELGTVSTAYEPYEAQTLTVSTPNGLPGIPVASGGNYTDEAGQQWVCDEIDLAKGVHIQRVGKKTFSTKDGWDVAFVSSSGLYRFYTTISNAQPNDSAVFCNLTKGVSFDKRSFSTDGICFMYAAESSFAVMTSAATTLDEWGALLAETPMELLFVAQTPTETALDTDALAAYAELYTHYPNTTVTADGATAQVSYVADTKLYVDNKFAELAAVIVNNS